MTEHDSNKASQLPTHLERFNEACKTTHMESYLQHGPDSGYLVWDVQHVHDGENVTVDGPFFTEEEAQISAELLRGTFLGARAHKVIHNRIRCFDRHHEQVTFDQACMSRSVLAIRLSSISTPSTKSGLPGRDQCLTTLYKHTD
ncbi:hypothetical protein K9857_08585 [Pseudomonas sp. REP124]|uniref:hypothetical protein n=1 Tax=Pseudomonas sp. REP124 TaxID=2875731 RepID=UPI001CCDAFB6|nr:hypothetical protein [Pseudomonas sp. REP124]MBZ9781607.1 hypothetical protein [Pseudomonas sp. REP124]